MDDHNEAGPDEIEWLDLAPTPQRPPRRSRPWLRYALLALAVVAGVVAVRAGHRPGPVVAPLPVVGASTPVPPPADVAQPPVAVTDLGYPLLTAPDGLELTGLGPEVLVRIQLALGEITTTAIPPLASDGPVSLLAGPDQVIVRPVDQVRGYLVPDGRPATTLPPVFGPSGPALPGPDPDHLWVATGSGAQAAMALVSFEGIATAGASIPLPPDAGLPSADGAGYLVYTAIGGVYDARPGDVQRITTGTLLAAGPTRWLTVECDDHHVCETTVIDRATGAGHTIPVPSAGYLPGGVISPDGRIAALIQVDAAGAGVLHLLDLVTGTDQTTGVSVDAAAATAAGTLAWFPDSARLLVADAARRLRVVEAATGHAADFGIPIPPLTQLMLHTAPAP